MKWLLWYTLIVVFACDSCKINWNSSLYCWTVCAQWIIYIFLFINVWQTPNWTNYPCTRARSIKFFSFFAPFCKVTHLCFREKLIRAFPWNYYFAFLFAHQLLCLIILNSTDQKALFRFAVGLNRRQSNHESKKYFWFCSISKTHYTQKEKKRKEKKRRYLTYYIISKY